MIQNQTMDNAAPAAIRRSRFPRGVCILEIGPESPAAKAGMMKDDVIIQYDGIAKLSTGKLADRIAEAEPGLSIPVIFVRDGREHSLSLPSGPLGILGKDTVVHVPTQEEPISEGADTASTSPSSPTRRITVGLVALAFKFGPKMGSALVSIFKGLKVGKVGLAAASMAAYSCLLTWQFALLIMFALFVHESGHIWAMKRSGLKTKGIYFIPLLGAAAVSDGEFPSRRSEAFIALMGPIWGLACTAVTGGVYLVVQEPVLAAAAGWMAAVNLFNLLPVNPLDGGRVFKSIAYSTSSWLGLGFLILGVVVTAFLATAWGMGLFVLLLIVGIIDLLVEYRRRVQVPRMTAVEMAYAALMFMFVTGMLWALMSYMDHVPGADLAMKFMKGDSQ